MITSIVTVKFFKTKKDAEDPNGYNPQYGLLLSIDNESVIIIDDKGNPVPYEEMYTYSEIRDIGLHNLKIGS